MKQQSATAKPKKPVDWDAVCERTRQRCNNLTEKERERLQDEALRIIYGQPRKTAPRRG